MPTFVPWERAVTPGWSRSQGFFFSGGTDGEDEGIVEPDFSGRGRGDNQNARSRYAQSTVEKSIDENAGYRSLCFGKQP